MKGCKFLRNYDLLLVLSVHTYYVSFQKNSKFILRIRIGVYFMVLGLDLTIVFWIASSMSLWKFANYRLANARCLLGFSNQSIRVCCSSLINNVNTSQIWADFCIWDCRYICQKLVFSFPQIPRIGLDKQKPDLHTSVCEICVWHSDSKYPYIKVRNPNQKSERNKTVQVNTFFF